MLSNYPPGVTGNELAIAGPDAEYDDYKECESLDCRFAGGVSCWAYDGIEHWECPDCGHDHEIELSDYYDPDMAYDEARERRLFD